MTLREYAALRELRGHYAVAPEHESEAPIRTRSRQSS
jgi:hypothetical protein